MQKYIKKASYTNIFSPVYLTAVPIHNKKKFSIFATDNGLYLLILTNMRKKNFILALLLMIAAITVNAQPPQGMRGGMGQGRGMGQGMGMAMGMANINPASDAKAMAKELKLKKDVKTNFIAVYTEYLKEQKEMSDKMPKMERGQRGQAPSEEQRQKMQENMKVLQEFKAELMKKYTPKFVEILGDGAVEKIEAAEKEVAQQKMEEMRANFGGGMRGGFGGGGFGGGMGGPGGGMGGGFGGGGGF